MFFDIIFLEKAHFQNSKYQIKQQIPQIMIATYKKTNPLHTYLTEEIEDEEPREVSSRRKKRQNIKRAS